MRAITRTQTKFSGGLSIYVDADRKEVVVRDDFGTTHRFNKDQAWDLLEALRAARFELIMVKPEVLA